MKLSTVMPSLENGPHPKHVLTFLFVSFFTTSYIGKEESDLVLQEQSFVHRGHFKISRQTAATVDEKSKHYGREHQRHIAGNVAAMSPSHLRQLRLYGNQAYARRFYLSEKKPARGG